MCSPRQTSLWINAGWLGEVRRERWKWNETKDEDRRLAYGSSWWITGQSRAKFTRMFVDARSGRSYHRGIQAGAVGTEGYGSETHVRGSDWVDNDRINRQHNNL